MWYQILDYDDDNQMSLLLFLMPGDRARFWIYKIILNILDREFGQIYKSVLANPPISSEELQYRLLWGLTHGLSKNIYD